MNWSQNRGRTDGDFISTKFICNRELRQSLLKPDPASKPLPNLVGQPKLSIHLEKGVDRADDQLHGGGAGHAQVGLQTETRTLPGVLVGAGKAVLLWNVLRLATS